MPPEGESDDPTVSTEAAETLPMADDRDVGDATRGLVACSNSRKITAADGRVVWDLDAYVSGRLISTRR